jgi:hypothetical protein
MCHTSTGPTRLIPFPILRTQLTPQSVPPIVSRAYRVAQIGTSCVRSTGNRSKTHVTPVPIRHVQLPFPIPRTQPTPQSELTNVFMYIRVAQIGTSCVRSTGNPNRTHVIPIPVGKGGFELRRTNISKPQLFSEVSIARAHESCRSANPLLLVTDPQIYPPI